MKAKVMAGVVCVAGMFLSCKKGDETPPSTVPSVEFKSLQRIRTANNYIDSLSMVFLVTDGDKDLGILDWSNYSRNLYVTLSKKIDNVFKEVDLGVPLDASLPSTDHLKPGMQIHDGPFSIKRISTYTLEIAYSLQWYECTGWEPYTCIWRGDTIRFDIQVVDRAGNKSNTITTSELLL